MIEVGQKVTCKPYIGLKILGIDEQNEVADAVITYVNKRNHWFQVEYGDGHLQTCFKFSDIGRTVNLA